MLPWEVAGSHNEVDDSLFRNVAIRKLLDSTHYIRISFSTNVSGGRYSIETLYSIVNSLSAQQAASP